ncbi:MAG: TetR/AcrR family transcriptional regulator [Ignavibacteriaceae bacterium]|nr:TetR/AcrR family transcriptional regulator [Ignavibacteriaceae bacterium]NUM72090.1 TetR/AcrR family transcriptional regulator [Ignavibacteriaceae bacterium]
MRTRAITESQKNERIKAILTSAEKLFLYRNFNSITVQEIAADAGLAKGSVYSYFTTKESVYLALLEREFADWFKSFNEAVSGAEAGTDPRFLSDIITKTFSGRELFLSLTAILHTLLEENLPGDDIFKFKLFLISGIAGSSEILESRISYLTAGEGRKVLVTLYALILGVRQISAPSAAALKVISETPELHPLKFDFMDELRDSLGLFLTGIYYKNTGKDKK